MAAAGTAVAADVDLSGFDKVLLPLDPTVEITGANGATFGTAWEAAPGEPIRFYPAGANLSQATVGTFTSDPIMPGAIAPQVPASAAGRLLYVEKGKLDRLHPQTSLMTKPAGAPSYLVLWTSVPIVRERDFRSGPVVFATVPSPYVYLDQPPLFRTPYPQYRYLLRIYDVDNRGDVEVRVVIEDLAFMLPGKLSETIVPLSRREGNDPSQPYYAALAIGPLCHPFSSHTPCAGGTMRVRVEPVTPGARFWTMLSLTNNFTQDVTLFWPQ